MSDSLIFFHYFKTPVGELILGSFDGKLCLCDWRYRKMRDSVDSRIEKYLNACLEPRTTPIIEETIRQLTEYFAGERTQFEIPLLLAGTHFQESVWNELQKIPFGKTISYQELSRNLGNEKAIRAVATANGANAISILIPCHRIIGKDGSLVGYAGGLPAKKKLLEIEDALTDNQMKLF
ncbi:MAG: methylated-DNA--[protein]-cysteine S-methyltransferase [Flavobacteriales bacterium]